MKLFNSIILLCFSGVMYAQNLDCERFKEGHFVIETEDSGPIFIVRDKKTQREIQKQSNIEILYRIKWESPCVYTLKVKKVISNPTDLVFDKKIILRVEILETKTDSYIHETSILNFDFKMSGEVFVVK